MKSSAAFFDGDVTVPAKDLSSGQDTLVQARLWEFSVERLGSTWLGAILPAEKITTIYFPARRTRAIQLFLTSFPNEVTELALCGPK